MKCVQIPVWFRVEWFVTHNKRVPKRSYNEDASGEFPAAVGGASGSAAPLASSFCLLLLLIFFALKFTLVGPFGFSEEAAFRDALGVEVTN